MGFKLLEIKLPVNFSEVELEHRIRELLALKVFTWEMVSKSLDARKKNHMYWLVRVQIQSDEIRTGEPLDIPTLEIPFRERGKKVLVMGSGPAGFFAGYILQKAGYEVVIIERGSAVKKRSQGILFFEKTGKFNPLANYAFGEGGAGTFSDGKLTSRSKHISREKAFILSTYVAAGAPAEIAWMAHPHVGSDFLKRIVENLRKSFMLLGGQIQFETMISGFNVTKGKVIAALTSNGDIEADYFLLAPGHSSYETFRMLMDIGVGFRTKNFALGSRAEHPQSLINVAQWGTESVEGLKAAEYRLTSPADGKNPVYSFCMCPGGIVVPASPYANSNIVNGMSYYRRAGKYANAACVAGVSFDKLAGKALSPVECLDWLEALERKFFDFSKGFKAPFCSIQDFITGRHPDHIPDTSYPLGLEPAPLWELLPPSVAKSMKDGLKDFSRKITGYEKGILIGLESKTSSPIQAMREPNGLCTGFDNLFIMGEGSGYAGGIISSAADGIRVAMGLV